SRLGNFRIADLQKLLWDEKKLFEYWTPIASLVLTEDYPIYNSLMKRYPGSLSGSWKSHETRARKFLADHRQLRTKVLNQLKKGPLQVGGFAEHLPKKSLDGWTPASTVSRMLFHLHMTGDIMVVGHQGNQNLWGLTDTFLPDWVERKEVSEEEYERQAAQRAILALGISTASEINYYFVRGRYKNLKTTLAKLVEEGEIHRIDIDGMGKKEERYVHSKDLSLLQSVSKDFEPRMSFIAPFDNLIAGRQRTNRLFGFDYVHEQFLPKEKRRYGTYVLPILWGEELIGRADMRLDKQSQTLEIISLHAQPSTPDDKEIPSKIKETMEQFGEFLGTRQVAYSSRVPRAWRSALH
ncbi:YcaQ family DNA glycosylase, partial [Candidatus Bathyarchaeota archaeon]|nr:YcaQ family DNA glycosylase [Candidatus Bathyarchaeota archaeon]